MHRPGSRIITTFTRTIGAGQLSEGAQSGEVRSSSTAGVTDWALDGSDNSSADRALAHEVVEAAPWFKKSVRVNRTYGHLAVNHLAMQRRIAQFLDLGCGLPTRNPRYPHTWESASAADRDARVIHVDADRMVAQRARMMLSGPSAHHPFVHADIRQILAILKSPAVQSLDLQRPVGVLLHNVLPWITSDADAHYILDTLRSWLPPGSAISLTHATADLHPGQANAAADCFRNAGIPMRLRSAEQLRELLTPWGLLSPSMKPTGACFPTRRRTPLPDHHSGAYAAIAVHPDPAELAHEPSTTQTGRTSQTRCPAHPGQHSCECHQPPMPG
ncbi:SAM-dependent methyltransferase [Streptomyces sp. NPDC087532]|uniref:SAM-dependent methyltransferase n=1 Tax=Streptomyces sp. NPDC087532 TaxID=3365795 RepID=UPI003808BD3B